MSRQLTRQTVYDAETRQLVERWVEEPVMRITLMGVLRVIGIGIGHLFLRLTGRRR